MWTVIFLTMGNPIDQQKEDGLQTYMRDACLASAEKMMSPKIISFQITSPILHTLQKNKFLAGEH